MSLDSSLAPQVINVKQIIDAQQLVDVKLTRELFEMMAQIGHAMFTKDAKSGEWALKPAAPALCQLIDPEDPELPNKALAAYLAYLEAAGGLTVVQWVP
jgi:hypothetical protein